MPFNTYTFIIFFIIFLTIHYSLKNWQLQKINLIIASYIFYSAWNPLFVSLLIFSTAVDWILAKKIFQEKCQRYKRIYLFFSLFANIGLLGYFKYGSFLVDNAVFLFDLIGIEFRPSPMNIILPVGISFYTFQTLSYTIDTYRGDIKPAKSFLDYAIYVSFFPQLVAGPIVRANDFLPQCESPRRANQDQFGWGLSLLVIGLFMKIMFADTILAPVVDKVYSNPGMYNSIETWAAILAFSGQIFSDFAGYSTAAIGVALCFGFILPDNFKSPYGASGFSDFWQRWHISLSSWLRDYVYVSLGGNRVSSAVRIGINLMITMLIGGIWHGASWLFVIWGGLHGLYLIVEHSIPTRWRHTNISSITKMLLILSTFFIVSLTWVFFRSGNMNVAIMIFSNLVGGSTVERESMLSINELILVSMISLSILFWHIFRRNSTLEDQFSRLHPILKGTALTSMLLIIFLFAAGDDRAFIYFQF
jgi:alginate O-acetyltransferase complex protein AlgI